MRGRIDHEEREYYCNSKKCLKQPRDRKKEKRNSQSRGRESMKELEEKCFSLSICPSNKNRSKKSPLFVGENTERKLGQHKTIIIAHGFHVLVTLGCTD